MLSHNELFQHDPVVHGDLLTSQELIMSESLFQSTSPPYLVPAGVWEAKPVAVELLVGAMVPQLAPTPLAQDLLAVSQIYRPIRLYPLE
jgi:hypothetical protein